MLYEYLLVDSTLLSCSICNSHGVKAEETKKAYVDFLDIKTLANLEGYIKYKIQLALSSSPLWINEGRGPGSTRCKRCPRICIELE